MTTTARIAAVRRFSRFYTRKIGVLDQRFLKSSFSLSEGRVLYELAHRRGLTARDLGEWLGMDAGYLSRMLKGFAKRGLVRRTRSTADGRERYLELTPAGRRAFTPLDRRSHADVGAMLGLLRGDQQQRLVEAMGAIESLFGTDEAPALPAHTGYTLRDPRPGDIGWIIHRQEVLYHAEYGWNEEYGALIAGILSRFVTDFDPKTEKCWIAEHDGQIAGSVFVVKKSKTKAQLRLLYVEPSARGLGIGRRLVDECVRFARAKKYRTMTLWTNDVLVSARRIYEAAGFRLVKEEKHHSFGRDLTGQNWELKL
ncbi:MAG: bifunctional helix-turn-helix transcriptional regulator/GNAT family N-acetyltransferase [Gemmatimonadaceae bacterium]